MDIADVIKTLEAIKGFEQTTAETLKVLMKEFEKMLGVLGVLREDFQHMREEIEICQTKIEDCQRACEK